MPKIGANRVFFRAEFLARNSLKKQWVEFRGEEIFPLLSHIFHRPTRQSFAPTRTTQAS